MFRYLKRTDAPLPPSSAPGASPRRTLVEQPTSSVARRRRAGRRTRCPATGVVAHRVEVLLNQAEVYAHPGDGYEPLSGYVTAIEFTVDAISAARGL